MWLLLNYFKLSNGESKWYDIWIIFKLCNYIFSEWKKRKTFSNFRSFFSRFTITHVSRLYKYRKNSESAVFAASIYPRPCTKLQLEKPQDVSSHNCTTRVLHTVISTQSPSIDSNDYSPSPPLFFSSLSFFISLSSSRYLSLFFLNVRPSFLFMFWQLMVSVAVSAAGWSAASATTRGKNERRRSSRAGQAPYAAAEAEAIASIRRICWPSPGAGAHRRLARRPRRRTTRVFRVSTRRPPRPRSAPPRITNTRPRSRHCRTTVASPRTGSRARRSRPWCPATATWRYPGGQGRPVGAAAPPPRPPTDWSRFTTIWG